MPISTSGLSVPQLSGNGGVDASIYGAQKTPQLEVPKGMTIGDMLDVSKKSLDLQKYRDTYSDQVKQIQAESQNAQQNAQQNTLKTVKAHVSNLGQATSELMSDPDLTPEKILNAYKNVNKSAPGDEASKMSALQQVISGMPQRASNETEDHFQTRLQRFVATNHLKGLDHLSAVQQAYPATAQADVGGNVATINQGNPALAAQAPGSMTGQYLNKTIAPQVYTNPITGQPGAIGGGGLPSGGDLTNRPTQVQVNPAAGGAPAAGVGQNNQPAAPTGQARPVVNPASAAPQQTIPNDALGKVEPLRQGANESPANFNARIANVQGSYAKAQDQLSNPNSENGYIPQLKQVNSSILSLLKDPEVRTGAVNDFLAGKTNKGSLSTKEQELAKYLEQRIQAKTPKSDADAESKRSSYGSFNLDKEALKALTRQDNAWVTTQELASRGRMNNALIGGSTNNPNYARVDAFNNKFAQLSSTPDLMQYIAIAGTNPNKIRVDADDDKALRALLGKMTLEQRQQLELKRKTLLNMVGQ